MYPLVPPTDPAPASEECEWCGVRGPSIRTQHVVYVAVCPCGLPAVWHGVASVAGTDYTIACPACDALLREPDAANPDNRREEAA